MQPQVKELYKIYCLLMQLYGVLIFLFFKFIL